MWHKTIIVKYKGRKYPVLVWLADSDANGTEIVRVQSMVNEYYLMEKIVFEGRDNAYDFIKTYPPAMAKSFLIRTAYEIQAFE